MTVGSTITSGMTTDLATITVRLVDGRGSRLHRRPELLTTWWPRQMLPAATGASNCCTIGTVATALLGAANTSRSVHHGQPISSRFDPTAGHGRQRAGQSVQPDPELPPDQWPAAGWRRASTSRALPTSPGPPGSGILWKQWRGAVYKLIRGRGACPAPTRPELPYAQYPNNTRPDHQDVFVTEGIAIGTPIGGLIAGRTNVAGGLCINGNSITGGGGSTSPGGPKPTQVQFGRTVFCAATPRSPSTRLQRQSASA